ncbi:Arylsulfatase [Paramyrothecium foliicola]|nr:Arylsulfatase [Paramyrothecium foliicola]
MSKHASLVPISRRTAGAVGVGTYSRKPISSRRLTQLDVSTDAADGKRPNVILALTDDQDLHMNSLDYMPLLKKRMLDQGAYPKFVDNGLNDNYLPVWLQAAGYDAYYTGKLAKGWTWSNFLLDPFIHVYYKVTFQRKHDPPTSYEGEHSVDVMVDKSYEFLEEAARIGNPFFLDIAPPAPHTDVQFNEQGENTTNTFQPPVPARRHEHLFQDLKVPRTEHFKSKTPSDSVAWMAARPFISNAEIDSYDHFYRQRLQKLDLLDNTYVMYTTDNGFHIGQHCLPPGKECGFEEDINISLVVTGPIVPAGVETNVVTTHTDLLPTILKLAKVCPPLKNFDGVATPLSQGDVAEAQRSRHEHVTIEFWGFAQYEGREGRWRAQSQHGEHELYILKATLQTDPYERHKFITEQAERAAGVPLGRLISRLDALILVLESYKGKAYVHFWAKLHPQGNVETLQDVLVPLFDDFYSAQQRVSFDRCELGYVIDAESPQFPNDGLIYRDGVRASEWT